MAGAVVVVEEVLRVRIVDVENGVTQRAVGGHGSQADDACGGLFRAADDTRQLIRVARVQGRVQVGAVIHDDLRVRGDDRLDVAVVGVHVLAGDGVDVDAVVLHQSSGRIVLRGQRVAGAQLHLRAAGCQRAHEVCRFRGHMHAGADAHAL